MLNDPSQNHVGFWRSCLMTSEKQIINPGLRYGKQPLLWTLQGIHFVPYDRDLPDYSFGFCVSNTLNSIKRYDFKYVRWVLTGAVMKMRNEMDTNKSKWKGTITKNTYPSHIHKFWFHFFTSSTVCILFPSRARKNKHKSVKRRAQKLLKVNTCKHFLLDQIHSGNDMRLRVALWFPAFCMISLDA